jgi:hypothetical protein
MKHSNDYVYVYKSADGVIKGIVKATLILDIINQKFKCDYDIVYDENNNNLIESVTYC